MDKRNWLWKRKSSERSSGETESSGSISLHSERYSDEQDILKESPYNDTQSPEVTSKATVTEEEIKDSVKILTEKLSAALVNVRAKEDLVKQHSKVAEEAVAGWEKAENEAAALKQQLEVAFQHNTALEVRVSHLDSALKECVRQLRQANEEQEQRIHDAVVAKTREFEEKFSELQTHIESAEARSPRSVNPDVYVKLESLDEENSELKAELFSLSEELEIRTIERDLSAQAAENASKQQLESIKKVAKLEAECRRLQTFARKSSFKNEKVMTRNLTASSVEIDMMDDFLEMERLAALHDSKTNIPCAENIMKAELEAMTNHVVELEDKLAKIEAEKAELENMTNRMAELEEKLVKIEAEKTELENALNKSQDSLRVSQAQLGEADIKLEELHKELVFVTESKESLELRLIGLEGEARTMETNIDSLKAQLRKEKNSSAEMEANYRELEMELTRKSQEVELQKTAGSNGDVKVKQEDLAVAADKLAECQRTIASLGRQLQSLATLEDFLIDTTNLPGLDPEDNAESWKWHSNGTFVVRSVTPGKMIASHLQNGNDGESPASSSSSTSSTNNLLSSKSLNGFGKLFSKGKNGLHLENHQG